MRYTFYLKDKEIIKCMDCPCVNTDSEDNVSRVKCNLTGESVRYHYYDNSTKPDNCPLQELNNCWSCPVQR